MMLIRPDPDLVRFTCIVYCTVNVQRVHYSRHLPHPPVPPLYLKHILYVHSQPPLIGGKVLADVVVPSPTVVATVILAGGGREGGGGGLALQ